MIDAIVKPHFSNAKKKKKRPISLMHTCPWAAGISK